MGEALKQLWQWWSAPAVTAKPEPTYRVGEYSADYSPLTPEEMAAEDQAVQELFKRSQAVSR